MPATYTVKQVADILGYSTNSIYTFLKEKRIKGVRVGRGRFRIPQSELNRLLLANQKDAAGSTLYTPVQFPGSLPPPVVLPTGVVEPPHEGLIASGFLPQAIKSKVEIPSLFDWFVGMGSIILGLAMFLFSRVYEEFSFRNYIVWMPTLRTSLITAGFGLLLTDIVGRKISVWHKVFHWILALSYIVIAFVMLRSGNFESVIVYSLLALTLIITYIVQLGGIAGFAIYVVSLIALLPVAALFDVGQSSFAPLLTNINLPTGIQINVWMIGTIAVGVVIWLGYMRDRRVFWAGMLGVSILLIILSVQFAQNLSWGRSLFVLLTGLICLFVPIWGSLTFAHKRDRAFVFGVFGSILILFIITVGVIRMMQTNILDYAGRALKNKVSYGKSFMETTVASSKVSLSSFAANPILIEALTKKDAQQVLSLSRIQYESNSMVRRIVILDAQGNLVAVYPHTQLGDTNFAYRDYFIRASSTKSVVTSDIFETVTDQVKRKVVVVAVPVLDTKSRLVGVIAGSLALDTLGSKLQQIAETGNGEYFLVTDKAGRKIIHPDASTLGELVDATDPLRSPAAGSGGLSEGYGLDGIRSLIAYEGIEGSDGWMIAIKAPVSTILEASNTARITVFSVTFLCILIISVFLLSYRMRTKLVDSGSVYSGQIAHTKPAALPKAEGQKQRGKGRKREDTS